MNATAKSAISMTQPIIIELGRQKSKKLKEFKQGEGELWEEVRAVVEKVHAEMGAAAADKVVVPVVLIYEKKAKRPSLDKLIFP